MADSHSSKRPSVAEMTAHQRDRFWGRVNKTGSCWEWLGWKDNEGYGRFSLHSRSRRAHRISWELLRGPIPEKLTLDHVCRNRACVNPDHLEPVTNAVNILRGVSPSAIQARKTHCVHGHPFSGDNVWLGRKGRRFCRTCWAIRDARRSPRRREVPVKGKR